MDHLKVMIGITRRPTTTMTKVNEEKLLNEMFVLLEYSDTFKAFVEGMPEDMKQLLGDALRDNSVRCESARMENRAGTKR